MNLKEYNKYYDNCNTITDLISKKLPYGSVKIKDTEYKEVFTNKDNEYKIINIDGIKYIILKDNKQVYTIAKSVFKYEYKKIKGLSVFKLENSF